MDERIRIITHADIPILYADYRGLRTREVINLMDQTKEYQLKLSDPILRISDLRGVFFLPSITEKATEVSNALKHLTIKMAVVIEISPTKKTLFNIYNKATGNKAKIFNSLTEAKNWAVS